MKKITQLSFVWLFVLFLSACAPIIERPKISIDKIELGEVSFTKGAAIFTLTVQNPNLFPLYLSGIEYGLKLNGVTVADAQNNHAVTIAAGTEKKLQIPVTLKTATLVRMIPQFLGDRQFKYELNGLVKTPIINLPFHRVGGILVAK